MARQPSHRWPSRVRFDQQGLEQGRGELSAYPCRSTSSQTATLARSVDQATRTRGGSAGGGEGVRHRILVVEDNPLNRELLCDWREVEGHEVWSVEDLSAAMSSIEDRPPDAVLLDVQQHRVGRPVFDGTHGGTQILDTPDFVTFYFPPVTKQFAVQRVIFDDEDAVSHTFSATGGATTRPSCLINASCQGCCLRRSASAWVRR